MQTPVEMDAAIAALNFVFFFLSSTSSFVALPSSSSFLGLHPLDEKYFSSEVIKCKDGSKTFTRDRINDDFCDCSDGTDEPGTSACPASKFYCRNVGSTPQFLFSSRVNDHICDCCDGSDENDGRIHCPNSCVMDGHVEYISEHHVSKLSDLSSLNAKEVPNKSKPEDLFQNVEGLKVLIFVQAVLITIVVGLRLFRQRPQSKRRHHRGGIPP